MSDTVQVWHFDPTDRIEIDHRHYTWAGTSEHCYTFTAFDDPNVNIALSFENFEAKRKSVGFGYCPQYFNIEVAAERERLKSEYFADLTEKRRSKALWKLDHVRLFLELENAGKTARSDDKLKESVKQITSILSARPKEERKNAGSFGQTKRAAPKHRTLLAWVNRYEDGGCHPLSLVDDAHRSGNRDGRFDAEVLALMAKHRDSYCTRARETRTATYNALLDDIEGMNIKREAKGFGWLQGPTFKAYSNYINELGPFHIYAGRRGLDAAVKRFRGSYGGVSVVRPGQLVEMDEWQIQLHTLFVASGVWDLLSSEQRSKVEKERRWLCVALDVATISVMGMRLAKTSSVDNALNTLRMACSDKSAYAAAVGAETPWYATCGIEMLRTDNGSSLISERFRGAAVDLGITPDIAPAAFPELRAHIERLFGTFDRQLIGKFLGRSFSGVSEKGDEDPRDFATLTVDELCDVLVRFVVDVYHNSPHGGLNGETPYNAWKRLTKLYKPRMPADSHRMRAAFGIEVERKIETRGIRVLGLYYNDDWLMKLWRASGKRTQKVRLGPDDLGAISVRSSEGNWVTVPCVDEEMRGVQVETWIAAERDLARRFKQEADLAKPIIMRALRAINAIREGANARTSIKYGVTVDDITRWERLTTFSFPIQKEKTAEGGAFDLREDLIPVGRPAEVEPTNELEPSAGDETPPNRKPRAARKPSTKRKRSPELKPSTDTKPPGKKPKWTFEDPT
ncbi:MAG: hypothetical protein DI534_14965 [Leifsonia xyli]|nr:MAG: hypothetical protein DI534_14965 [Leifsonia xyli]